MPQARTAYASRLGGERVRGWRIIRSRVHAASLAVLTSPAVLRLGHNAVLVYKARFSGLISLGASAGCSSVDGKHNSVITRRTQSAGLATLRAGPMNRALDQQVKPAGHRMGEIAPA
jgi:hypothetical protein